jgi:hypothetical protein
MMRWYRAVAWIVPSDIWDPPPISTYFEDLKVRLEDGRIVVPHFMAQTQLGDVYVTLYPSHEISGTS